MKNNHCKNISIIGAGMVGTAIGYLLKKAGHTITAIIDKSPSHLQRAYAYTGGELLRHPQETLFKADYILITTPDDIILSVCQQLSQYSSIKGKYIFHMSGACGLDLLESAKKAGAFISSIHPLQSFSSIDSAIQNIPGSYFGITTQKKAQNVSERIVSDLGGISLMISDHQKPLYHAAACLASNYLVSLLNAVESFYQACGISEKDARKAYLPLVMGSLKNIENSGSVQALTGPIARGDCGTVQKHISAIRQTLPQYDSLYKTMGLVTVDLAKRKKSLTEVQAKKIVDHLKGDSREHSEKKHS